MTISTYIEGKPILEDFLRELFSHSGFRARLHWSAGQVGVRSGGRGGREINFPGFPNLHSAAKKSICLIYREVGGGEEIAAALNYGKHGFGPAAKTSLAPCWPEWRRNSWGHDLGDGWGCNVGDGVQDDPWVESVGGRRRGWRGKMMLGFGYLTLYQSHNGKPNGYFLSWTQWFNISHTTHTPVEFIFEWNNF